MQSTNTMDRAYHAVGIVILALYLTCAVLGVLVATPYLDDQDPILVRVAVTLGLVGILPLLWYLARTMTVLVAKGRIDRDPDRPNRGD